MKLTKEAVVKHVMKSIGLIAPKLKESREVYVSMIKEATDTVLKTSMIATLNNAESEDFHLVLEKMQLMHLVVLSMSMYVMKEGVEKEFIACLEKDMLGYLTDGEIRAAVVVEVVEGVDSGDLPHGPHGPGCTCPPEDDDGSTQATKH